MKKKKNKIDLSFLIGQPIRFIVGWEDWGLNDFQSDIREYVAVLSEENKFTFSCIRHEKTDRWGGDLANYPDCHPTVEHSDEKSEDYENIRCNFTFCDISRRYNNIYYSDMFDLPQEDWEWEELSEQEYEVKYQEYLTQEAIFKKLHSDLKEWREKNQ